MRNGLLSLLLLVVTLARPAATHGEISPEQVSTAITRAVEYLKRQQNADGSWSGPNNFAGGVTALVTLSLLNAGVPADDEAIQKALAQLRGRKPQHTYVVALQTMVYCAAEPKKDLLLIRQNAKWLEDTQITVGRPQGRLGLSLRARQRQRRPFQQPVRPAGFVRSGARGNPGQRAHLGLGPAVLATTAIARRLVALLARPGFERQHDLRRHRVAGDCLGRAQRGRRASRRWRRTLLRHARDQRRDRPRLAVAGAKLFGAYEPQRRRPGGYPVSLAAVLPLRARTGGPDDGPPFHRPARLVPRRRRHAGAQPGRTVGVLERNRFAGSQLGGRHELRAVVSGQGTQAGAGGQGEARAGRRLEPPPQRPGELDRLRREKMGARSHLASDRSAVRHGRRLAASAGAVHQRAGGAAVERCGKETPARLHRPRRVRFRRGVLRRRQLREGFSPVDGRHFPRARVRAAPIAAGASDLARRGAGRSAVCRGRCGASTSAAARAWSFVPTTFRATGSWPAPAASSGCRSACRRKSRLARRLAST